MKQVRGLVGILFCSCVLYCMDSDSELESLGDRDYESYSRHFHNRVKSMVKRFNIDTTTAIPDDALRYCENKYQQMKPFSYIPDIFGLSLDDYHNLYKVAHGKKGEKTVIKILEKIPDNQIAIKNNSEFFIRCPFKRIVILEILMSEHSSFLSSYKRHWHLTRLGEKRFKFLARDKYNQYTPKQSRITYS